jgi:hypothetical protein
VLTTNLGFICGRSADEQGWHWSASVASARCHRQCVTEGSETQQLLEVRAAVFVLSRFANLAPVLVLAGCGSTSPDSRQTPECSLPSMGTHLMEMAFSGQAAMQCSSLPQSSGRESTATRFSSSRQAGPQASMHKPQPVHNSSIITGIHLLFKSAPLLAPQPLSAGASFMLHQLGLVRRD